MSIYRLYLQNGNVAGFWVQHRNWQNTCAQVQLIAGKRHGHLPGEPPLHDDAPVSLRFYDIRSGRPVPEMAATATAPAHDRRYILIAAPPWHRDAEEDQLDADAKSQQRKTDAERRTRIGAITRVLRQPEITEQERAC